MLVLVDMDGVLADFEQGFIDAWRKKHPNEFYIEKENRKDFLLIDEYPKKHYQDIIDVLNTPGFFKDLSPIEGAIEGIKEIEKSGLEVAICSSPLSSSITCAGEKYLWVRHHLGNEWAKKTILAKNKSLVSANYLIDDNPNINGNAPWEHIIFDAPYNQEVNSKKRLDWDNYKQVLNI